MVDGWQPLAAGNQLDTTSEAVLKALRAILPDEIVSSTQIVFSRDDAKAQTTVHLSVKFGAALTLTDEEIKNGDLYEMILHAYLQGLETLADDMVRGGTSLQYSLIYFPLSAPGPSVKVNDE